LDAYIRKGKRRTFAEQLAISSERSDVAAATVDRFINEQLARFEGYALTAEGRALWREHLLVLSNHIERARKFNKDDSARTRVLKREIRRFKSVKIAFAALASLLNSIGARTGEEKSPALDTKLAMARAVIGKRWPAQDLAAAGNWLLECCLHALPEIIVALNGVPCPTSAAVDRAAAIAELAIVPVFHPRSERPKPWTRWGCGAYWTERSKFSTAFVRDDRAEKDVKVAWAAGTMQPHVDGVNALQDVQWQINSSILDAVKKHGGGILARKVQRKYREKKYLFKRRLATTAIRAPLDVAAAVPLWKFYTPQNIDFRGRVYPLTHLNYGNTDHIRAMFRFADGKPIGDEGLRWLKIHTANVGDFGKISRRPFDERVAWVDAHLNDVSWKEADKPFLFLAAREELNRALAEGSNFKTTLPVAFDGSCNGLQHLAAMSLAEEEGALVNLVPAEGPGDIYQAVADRVQARLVAETGAHADICRGWPIDRGLLKPPVMTFAYSITLNGIFEQLWEGLEERRVKFNGDTLRWLAELVLETIEGTVHRPHEVMEFLRKCASSPLTWTTPTGLPWRNEYRVQKKMYLQLQLQGKRRQHKLNIPTDKFALKDAKNAVAANFVHACDASHLIMTINAAAAEGITNLACVHDSYGCLASDATRLNELIREQFVRMYTEHNVLAEIRERSKSRPDLPQRGALDLRAVLNSKYAFA
jgi:DNA-directed RNA polymerase, mitochondrial